MLELELEWEKTVESIVESPPVRYGPWQAGEGSAVATEAPATAAELTRPAGARPVSQRLAKRALDLVCATVLLAALVPLLLVVAVLIKLSSPGPILFAQRRIGKDGQPFTMYKFRTMMADNDASIHQAYTRALIKGAAPTHGGVFKLRRDPRVTEVGRILRATSLDEIPQLVNVLQGDMSLVGPRPPLSYEVELYGPRERGRLAVTPGLTGLWQVSGRSALNFQQMIDLDLAYIEHWSIWLDLRILFRTPFVVLTRQGAH